MIFVTGDVHGDLTRFRPFQRLFRKGGDFLLVCGDLGLVWDGSAAERKKLAKLEKLDCTILFVEGTHDNLDLLARFPEEGFAGGRARRIAKNLFWLLRGQIYTLGEKRIFAFGGGESMDADEREAGVNWWPQELPSVEEIARARHALLAVQNRVDLIITHEPPDLALGLIDVQKRQINLLGAFLRDLSTTVEFDHWYFGSEHIDRRISPRMTAVFQKILPCEETQADPKGKRRQL